MRNRATTPLSKAKIRQSWSKYNLYNLHRYRQPPTATRTFFQQKWAAKSISRAYHGEQIRESQWTRMFSRRLRSVVPMNPRNLATDDGSAISAGRGSGLGKSRPAPRTPYTQMTFAPMERRLDVAIFRAMLASSARQARQFVVHGAVTVNGKKMRLPGYLLNPGDLFQVEPERVMFATGAPKNKVERREGRLAKKATTEGKSKTADDETSKKAKEETKSEELTEQEEKEQAKESLKDLLTKAKTIMSREKTVLPAKKKQELRSFQKSVRSVLSKSATSTILTDSLETQFSELLGRLKAKVATTKSKGEQQKRTPGHLESRNEEPSNAASSQLREAFNNATEDPESLDTSELSKEEVGILKQALAQMRDNPIDSSKPYATPWRPRDYMAAFAFVPRYLEVHHKICAAVYLRHPVARPGFSEVPSPFGDSILTPAFVWYLRRR